MPTDSLPRKILRRMRKDAPSKEFLAALSSNRRNTSPIWAWNGYKPYYGAPYNIHPFSREASSNYYADRKYGSQRWERAYAHLLAKCLGKAAKGKKSKGGADASAGSKGGESSCACTDDSRSIPCDGEVHERTFGPVLPAWPDPGVKWGWEEIERVRGIAQHGHPINKRRDGSAAKQMTGDEALNTMLRDGPLKLWEKLGHRPSAAELHRARMVAVDVDRSTADMTVANSKYASNPWRGSSQKGAEWSREKRAHGDAGLKGLVRGYIGEDSAGLAAAIEDWVSKFTCESQRHAWCKTPYPEVVASPKSEGGSGERGALASEGGDNNWYVSDFAEIHGEDYTSGAALIIPAACVRASFRCMPGGVTIPRVSVLAAGAPTDAQQSQTGAGYGQRRGGGGPQDRNDANHGQLNEREEVHRTTRPFERVTGGGAPWEPASLPWWNDREQRHDILAAGPKPTHSVAEAAPRNAAVWMSPPQFASIDPTRPMIS